MDDLETTLRDAARATHRKAAQTLDLDAELTSTLRREVGANGFDGSATADQRSRRWLAMAAAAILVIVAGVALAARRDDGITTAEPETLPAATDPTTAPATTVPVESTTSVASPATTVPVPVGAPVGVSYLDPPAELTMRSLGAVSVPTPEIGGYSVAIGDLGVAVGTFPYGSDGSGRIEVVEFDGSARQLDVPVGGVIAYGPGDVVYTTRQAEAIQDFSVVAMPLSGDQAGTVVASTLADINDYVELPPAAFGHGERGIVQRDRDVGATAIEYVDVEGRATSLDEAAPPFYVADTDLRVDDLGGRVESSTGVAWTLTVEAAPDRAGSYVGPSPPAPTSGEAGVYWTHIGPNLRPDLDFGEPSMWVIARLAPDGSVTWWSIPDGWRVVASDVWGTVLAKQDGGQLHLAVAEFTAAPTSSD